MPTPAHEDGPCPCGRRATLRACCGRYHAGVPAPDAESLMRSRYAAYVVGDARYLLDTWHRSTRPATLDLDATAKWLGLDVRSHAATGEHDAIVEFVARYRAGGRGHRLHETSRFVREDGRWFYVDATFPAHQRGG